MTVPRPATVLLAALLAACGDPAGAPVDEWEASPLDVAVFHQAPDRVPDDVVFSPTTDLMVPAPRSGLMIRWMRAHVRASGRDPVVLVPRAYITLAGYVDGERVYALDDYRDASGVPFHVIPIPPDREVELVLRVGSRYTQVGIAPPRVGEHAALLTDLVVRDLPRLAMAIVLLAIAVTAAFLLAQRRERGALTGIAVLAIGIGGWALFQTRSRELWLPDLPFWFGVWWLSGSLIAGGASLFLASVFGDGPYRFLRWQWMFFAAHAFVAWLAFLAEDDFHVVAAPIWLAGRGVAILGTFAGLAFLVREVRRGVPDSRFILGGFSCVTVGVLHDVGVSIGVVHDGVLLADVGYVLLSLSFVVIVARRMRRMEETVVRHAERLDRFVEERDGLMRDLHDGLGGVVTNVRLLAERGRGESEGQVLSTIAQLADEGMSELRTLIVGFDALPATYRELAIELRRTGNTTLEGHDVEHRFESHIDEGAPAPDLARFAALARVHREALTNALKHAEASFVSVRIEASAAEVVLMIEDDGRGLPAEPEDQGPGRGRGLSSMKARAKAIGASVVVEPRSPSGTRVVLRAPLSKPAASGAHRA